MIGGTVLPWLAQVRAPSPPVGVPPGEWSWEWAIELLPLLLRGLTVTIRATLTGSIIAMVLGLVLALGRRSHRRFISWPVSFVIEFIRSTPLLAQLFFAFYAFPEFIGYRPSAFVLGSTVLGVHFATYASEAYRAGIEGVPKGQWEAAVSINLSGRDTWRHIILPQAIPTVIPALGNYVVAMYKDAVLLSLITVVELVAVADRIRTQTFRGMEPYLLAGALFLAVSIPAAIGVRFLERRYGYQRT